MPEVLRVLSLIMSPERHHVRVKISPVHIQIAYTLPHASSSHHRPVISTATLGVPSTASQTIDFDSI
jgi:hypothetical protein